MMIIINHIMILNTHLENTLSHIINHLLHNKGYLTLHFEVILFVVAKDTLSPWQ